MPAQSAENPAGLWRKAAQVDGTPAIEYHCSAGSITYNVVSLRKMDDTTLALTVSLHSKVDLEAVYKLSADGRTSPTAMTAT